MDKPLRVRHFDPGKGGYLHSRNSPRYRTIATTTTISTTTTTFFIFDQFLSSSLSVHQSINCDNCEYAISLGVTIHILGTGTCHREGYQFQRFWCRNGTDFYDLGLRNSIDAFSENWYKVGSSIYFRKIGIKSGIHFGKSGIRNGYGFEASMARPRPKPGQVPPSPGALYMSKSKWK